MLWYTKLYKFEKNRPPTNFYVLQLEIALYMFYKLALKSSQDLNKQKRYDCLNRV